MCCAICMHTPCYLRKSCLKGGGYCVHIYVHLSLSPQKRPNRYTCSASHVGEVYLIYLSGQPKYRPLLRKLADDRRSGGLYCCVERFGQATRSLLEGRQGVYCMRYGVVCVWKLLACKLLRCKLLRCKLLRCKLLR